MSNAAIYLHPNAFDTTGPELMGRHSAGESFLRGFIRFADVDRFHFWNIAARPQAEIEAMVDRIEPPGRPVSWIKATDRRALGQAGVMYIPSPQIVDEAWQRERFGARSYAVCGITHTTATASAMTILPNMLLAPLEDYDALICTSQAVRDAVESQLDMMRHYLVQGFGPRRRPEPQRVTIPLGVNTDAFAPKPEDRARWREELQIPPDSVVALYVGRFHAKAKMNPALMAMALERAAARTGRDISWVNVGWLEPPSAAEAFHDAARQLCPSVRYVHVDGRRPEVRFSIWAMADLFISFSDNIQETFGLTPVEAMAAGLPCVVSDWNGYKDTVRHGVDGFRVPTVAPRPGLGGDFAYWFSNGWLPYEDYVGGTAQYTAIDLGRAEESLVQLIENPDLRRTMGAAARQRAAEVFDWSAIIPQYQALWREQNARRLAREPAAYEGGDPYRPDPFTLFQGYPTRHLSHDEVVALRPGMDWAAAAARLNGPMATYSRFNRPTANELEKVVRHLAEHGPTPVAQLIEFLPEWRRNLMERAIIWLARHDVVALQPA